MSEVKWAIITGADGGMGQEITRAVAKAGYQIIMACYNPSKAEIVRQRLIEETGNPNLEVMAIDLSSCHTPNIFHKIKYIKREKKKTLAVFSRFSQK